MACVMISAHQHCQQGCERESELQIPPEALTQGTMIRAAPRHSLTHSLTHSLCTVQYWGWDAVLKAGGKVVGTIKGGNLTPGQTVNVGFVIQQATNDNFSPSSILVNNQKCL